MIDDYSGLQKAAILLITLGPEKASAIFQHLKEDEIESLTLEIANTRSVSPQDKESVLDEYYQVCLAQQYIAEGGIGYAKELLEKALGSEKAQGVISKLTASLQVRPFDSDASSQKAETEQDSQMQDSQTAQEDTQQEATQPAADAKQETVEPQDAVTTYTISVTSQDTCRTIAEKLKALNLVDDAEQFRIYMGQKGADHFIADGEHVIPQGASYDDIITILTQK